MIAKWARVGGRPWLLVRPETQAFGTFVTDSYMATLVARERGARLYLRPGARFRSVPLARVRVAGVDRADGAARAVAWGLWAACRPAARPAHWGLDVRRVSAERPLAVSFPDALADRAAALARAAGIDADAPLVTLHVREDASKAEAGDRDRDSARSGRVETYNPALDLLAARGVTVVRIGDPSMTPIRRPGVVDLATAGSRDPLLDLWCLARSRFFLAADSGPYQLSWFFDVPTLSVNVVNVVGVFPLRARDRYLPKRVREVATGRVLPLREMLAPEVLFSLRRAVHKERRLAYVDNTPEEIADAVREMWDATAGGAGEESASQRRFRQLVDAARSQPDVVEKVLAKAGIAEPFLGAGRVADAFARADGSLVTP